MSAVQPERVIPRPSERRRRHAGSAATSRPDITVIADPEARRDLRIEPTFGNAATFVAIGVLGVAASASGFLFLGVSQRESTSSAILLVPLVAGLAYAALSRWISSAHGRWFASLLFAALGVRLAAAVPRLMGGADAPIYQREGVRIARSLRSLDFGVSTGRSIPGTGAVRYFSGIVNVFTFGNYLGTFLVFVLIAFIGQCAFLLGIKPITTLRQFQIVAVLLAFSPTMMFWPSSVGKESLVIFGIGLTAFGASKIYDRSWAGLPPVLFGVFATGMARPHVAMITLLALLVGLFARQAKSRGRLASHVALLAVVIVGSMWTAGASAQIFELESLDGLSDVTAALDFAQDRTSQDQAQFTAPRVERPQDFPWAAVTVLFRPFPWEVNTAVALLSAVEGLVLALLVLAAAPGVLLQLPRAMQRGQLLFAIAFSSVFIFMFSAIGNFGILSRQRSQVIPFVLLLIAFGLAVDRSRGKARS